MPNIITDKYFTQEDFSRRKPEVLAEVTAKTGFKVEREIFRGLIYEAHKVGSLIYKGIWRGRPAVLKLQGLRPEVDESKMISGFNGQNRSRKIRLPELYNFESWEKKRGYGYLIFEFIDAPRIFKMPFASREQMNDFADFYHEYRTKAVTKPWLEPETLDSLSFVKQRIAHWQKMAESKKRLTPADYQPYVQKFILLAEKFIPAIPRAFGHSHLTANDIYKPSDGTYVLMSNLMWSYQLQYYDLTFNVWACLVHIRDTNYTYEEMKHYVEDWLAVYRTIPVIRQDHDFERKIRMLLLERLIGAILADFGVAGLYDREENLKYLRHLLPLHQRLFDVLAEEFK